MIHKIKIVQRLMWRENVKRNHSAASFMKHKIKILNNQQENGG
jgi:hypothetical protein